MPLVMLQSELGKRPLSQWLKADAGPKLKCFPRLEILVANHTLHVTSARYFRAL